MPDQDFAATIAGYRLVRKLAEGSRSSVFLGAGSTGPAALKVFHPDVAAESIGTELAALSRLDSPHFVRLLDVSSDRDETPILILERVRRGSVVTLLRGRDALEKGEVVTLVAPTAAAIVRLHQLGVGHQNIGATTLHVGAAGEPVLLGFGYCELFAPDGSIAAVEAEPAAARDRDALAELAVTLLSRSRDAVTDRRTVDMIEWLDSAPRDFGFPELLEARLFDFADPVPIEFGREATVTSAVPAGIRFGDRSMMPAASSAVPPPAATSSSATPERSDGVLGWFGALLLENPLESLKARALSAAKSVRKPFWFIAAGVVVAFVVVLVALPDSPSRSAVATTPNTSRAHNSPEPTQPALPADPVVALPILLAERTACIRALSVLCLAGVDEAASSAYGQDAELVEQLQGGTEIPKTAIIDSSHPALVELLGASAIISLGPPNGQASVLLIRDAGGWRIRSYLAGIQSTGSPTTDSNGSADDGTSAAGSTTAAGG